MTMVPPVLHFCNTAKIHQTIQNDRHQEAQDKLVLALSSATLQQSKGDVVQNENQFVRLLAADFWELIDHAYVSTCERSAPAVISAANDEQLIHDITYWGA